MPRPAAHVPEPALDLTDETPVSSAFGDVYFSRHGGVAETSHVFLRGNGLPERWQGRQHFTIGELGFGTGLNFLVTLQAFRKTADAGAVMHYIAIEKYPFPLENLRAVLALQPALAAEAEELLAAYLLRLPHLHRIHLPQAVLTLCIGDVAEMLEEIRAPSGIDAWFLDGFSPAKNPDMWGEEVLAQIGRLSAPTATLATFTAAGSVRRGLQSAGFVMQKTQGFGHKRDMLVGAREGKPTTPSPQPKSPILILGAGIAGATLAHALAERGYIVTVLERGSVAGGASGNAAGVLFPQLTKQWNISTAWYFTAYGFALRQLHRWQALGLRFAHATTGMLRLPRHAEEAVQLKMLHQTLGLDPAIVHWLEHEEASTQAGISLPTGAAFFPHGTWLSPAECCAALLQHKNIVLREHTAASTLTREGATWQVTLENDEAITTPQLCVASAYESTTLLGEHSLRLNQVGGQVTEFAASNVAAPLRSILCHKGYLIPLENHYLTGATYHREAMLEVTAERHRENLAELGSILPDWWQGGAVTGRSSIRATTPDRMPYVGTLAEGLYVSTGHGSRGLLSAPLAAEIIASSIAGESSPVGAELRKAVHPLRFRKG